MLVVAYSGSASVGIGGRASLKSDRAMGGGERNDQRSAEGTRVEGAKRVEDIVEGVWEGCGSVEMMGVRMEDW